MFQSILHTQETLQHFTGESFSAAVLDSEASKTVCGETWMNCYKETLSTEDQNSLTSEPSSTYFKFGDGRKVPSIMKVTIPATTDGQKVSIRTDIVKEEISLLLSQESMKKANTHIDFANDKVTMFGNQQDLWTTSSGHYAVSIRERARIDRLDESDTEITLIAKTVNMADKMKVARKLHSQFSHASTDKLLKLINNAGLVDHEELKEAVIEISQTCEICKVYRKPGYKPVVSVSLAEEFNEVVAMDL